MNNIALRLMERDSYFVATDTDEPDEGVYEIRYKGKPVLKMKKYLAKDRYIQISFGITKAELILENLAAIKEFVKIHRRR